MCGDGCGYLMGFIKQTVKVLYSYFYNLNRGEAAEECTIVGQSNNPELLILKILMYDYTWHQTILSLRLKSEPLKIETWEETEYLKVLWRDSKF